jgi:hypothetical protein
VADVLERDLSRFLFGAASRPFELGTHDCGLLLADWVKVRRGVDPAEPVRGLYHDAATLDALLPFGGLPRLFDRLFLAAGLVRTIAPVVGDVAMITFVEQPPIGAIRTGRGFAMLAQGQGVCSIPVKCVRTVAAWKV